MDKRPDEAELMNTLKTLRDEIRVRIHLAGMDAREAFERVERDAERAVGGATRSAIGQLIERLERVKHSIPPGSPR
jgi:hypothetical protein